MFNQPGVVLGGGIAGLAFAATAHRLGLPAVVLEASPELRASGSGLVLGPTAIKSLAFIGVRDAVIQAGRVLTDGYLTDLQLRPITRNAFGYFSDRTGEPFVGIERAELIQILAGAIPVCRTGVRYRSVSNHAEGIQVELPSDEKLDGAWAVLADGIRSAGRSAMSLSVVGDAGQWCWRGVAEGVELGDLSASFREGWGAEWRFGLVALGAGRTYWFVTQRSPLGSTGHARSAAETQTLLLEAVGKFPAIVGELIASTPPHQVLENRLEDLPALRRWHEGRIVCIGDAAHAMTPNLGLGATQALEDAVTLASMLHDCGGDMIRTAPLFVARRKARTERAVRESRLIGALAHVPDWLAPLRTGVMRRIPRQAALNQLAWAYEYDDLPRRHDVRDDPLTI